MENVVWDILYSSWDMVQWMVWFFFGFGILDWLMPCNPKQPMKLRSFVTDTAYCLIVPVMTRFVRGGIVAIGIAVLLHGKSQREIYLYLTQGFGPLGQLPIWLQAAAVFILEDIILYWIHRWFHGREMWPFHAIHHSSTTVDWHSTFRFHPVNVWLAFTFVDLLMMLAGFSPESVAVMGVFNLLYSAMVHANLNWTFGPFKYLFASPVFHRWHHTSEAEGMNKNFAPTFPLLDIMFGTFYMPEGRLPQVYGIAGSDMPEGFWAQLAWPFRQKMKKGYAVAEPASVAAGEAVD